MGYVTVTTYAEVDVDLDLIHDDDLVDELISRTLKDKHIKEILNEFSDQLHTEVSSKSRTSTLADKMKYEYLMKIFDKYSLTEIEDKFPNE